MKSSKMSRNDSAAILGIWGWTAVIILTLAILIIYPIRDELGDTILDFFAIFTDGTDLGEWLGGIIVGILVAMWNFGVSIGTGIFGP